MNTKTYFILALVLLSVYAYTTPQTTTPETTDTTIIPATIPSYTTANGSIVYDLVYTQITIYSMNDKVSI